MELGVDLHAVHGAEQLAAHGHRVERRLLHGAQAVGILVEVGVLAGLAQLVVVFNGGHEGVGGQAHLLGELLDGVGLHQLAALKGGLEAGGLDLLDGPGHALVALRDLLGGHDARAADGVEGGHVVAPVGVEDLDAHVAGLAGALVQVVVVGQALVAEALTLGVDLEEGLRAHPPHAGRGPVAALAAGHGASALEVHGGVGHIHLAAGEVRGAQTVARRARVAVHHDVAQAVLLVERVHHLRVGRVAAGSQHHALGGVHADVVAVLVLADDARDLAVLLDELDHRGGVAHVAALGLHAVAHDLGLGDGVVLEVVVQVADRVLLELLVGVGVDVGLKPHAQATVGHESGVPVHGLAGVLGPLADEGGVGAIGGVAEKVAGDLLDVHLDAGVLLGGGADAADVVAHAEAHGLLLEHDDVQARLGGRDGAGHAGGAGAHDGEVAVERLSELELIDALGGLAPHAGGRAVGADLVLGGVGVLGVGGLGGLGLGGQGRGDAGQGRGGGGAGNQAAAGDGGGHDRCGSAHSASPFIRAGRPRAPFGRGGDVRPACADNLHPSPAP